MTLHRLIGRKSLRVSGWGIFGIKTMHVSLIPAGMVPVRKNSLTARVTSSFSNNQLRWKNWGFLCILWKKVSRMIFNSLAAQSYTTIRPETAQNPFLTAAEHTPATKERARQQYLTAPINFRASSLTPAW